MTIRVLNDTLELEKRSGPKGSYSTNFAHIRIIDDGIEKSLDVFFNPHNRDYGLEVYQGPNYVVNAGERERSYSRMYPKFKGMPEKYNKLAHALYAKVAKRR